VIEWHRLRAGHYYAVFLAGWVIRPGYWPSGLGIVEIDLLDTGRWHWTVLVRGGFLVPGSGTAATLQEAQRAVEDSVLWTNVKTAAGDTLGLVP